MLSAGVKKRKPEGQALRGADDQMFMDAIR